jgi:hypothetical protein
MDTGVIIAIVIAALIVIAVLWLLGRRARERRLDTRREEAHQIRRDAEVSRAQADQTRAEADERAARARREEASAREQGAQAEARQEEARDRHMEAARVDPDVDADQAADRYDDEHGVGGITSHGRGEEDDKPSLKERVFGRSDADEDDGVEHHEQTRTADDERERHYERDENGDVVRDEEYRRPRA